MVETLTVHVNREGIHSVTAPSSVESDGSLIVVLRNHGEPTHVHLRLDGDLSRVATLGSTNHFVEGERRSVELSVADDPGWPVTGRLEVAAGYGQQTAGVDVTLDEPAPARANVAVAEDAGDTDSGGSSRGSAGGSSRGSGIGSSDRDSGSPAAASRSAGASTPWSVLPVAVLAVVALALAAVGVWVGGEAGLLGAAVVLASVVVAGYVLRTS